MATLRELLLAAEREREPLDAAIALFARSLLLKADDTASVSPESASALRQDFLSIHPRGELLLRIWPEQHGAGSRWEKRESFATFLHVVTHLLQTQQEQDVALAEAFALRVIRDKSAQLEKLLSWSDKPLIEFRALELLTVTATVSGVVARELVRLFNFQCPAAVKLATRRWKSEEETKQPFQVRAAYVNLVLTLTACPDQSVHRFAMKEGGVTASLFKVMDSDAAEMLTTIFDKLNHLVLYNPQVEHKNKLVVFNATCVHQLLALLQVEDEKVRARALGVLNALFFEESALYVVPQKQALRLFLAKSASSQEEEEEVTTSEQAYALKVIRNAVGTIGVNQLLRSTQAQTLVIEFLTRYPGFLSEYITALSVQLEPKPVYRWFCVASLVQKLLSCSLDAVVAGIPTNKNGDTFPSWCSAHFLASRLIAPGNFRKELSRCIQHTNNLVIYSALGVIEATLKRYVRLTSLLESLGITSEVQSELRFLLPSPEALVSLLLKLCVSQERNIALIYVRALTIFRLYLECLPQATREVKVDFTKTLTWRYLDGLADECAQDFLPAPMQGLIVGEMLRFLLAVDTTCLRFLFTKGSSDSRSKLQQVLLLYVSTPSRAVQELAGRVLQRTLLASDTFGQEIHSSRGRANEEVIFWLESLSQSGSKACAEFTEQIARAVMADPLLYVDVGSHVVANSSSSSALSPATVALVAFFNSRDGVVGKLDLSTHRADPCVVAFAVRILLALIPTSKHPQQLVALIAKNDAFANVDVSASNPLPDEKDKASIDDANGKKRKRSVSFDDTRYRDDAYAWLKTHCVTLASGKHASNNRVILKKKARAANSKWHRFSNSNALTAMVAAMTPVEFSSSWEHILSNCAGVDESFGPMLHYLSVRGDLDKLSLLTASTKSPATKNKQQKKQANNSAAAELFMKMIPTHVILQHILFSIMSKEAKEQNLAISAVTSIAKRRIKDHQLAVTDAARMCEQLLFFFSSPLPGLLENRLTQLSDLLLHLLMVVITADDDVPASTIVARIFFKLRALVGSTSGTALWQQISAVEIVAVRVYASINPKSELASLCDFDGLFQRSGIPLVALLASCVPIDARISVLDHLFRHSSVKTVNAPHVVLIQSVLESIGGKATNEHFCSFADYKRAKFLSRKLWQLLNSQTSKRQLSFFTTGFTVLGYFGGVDASTTMASIESSLVPLVVRSTQPTSNGTDCSNVLRAIISAIQGGNEAGAFLILFEKKMLKQLLHEHDERVKCELVVAIYNVFTRVTNPALRRLADSLIPSCYERVLLDSAASCMSELALLRHESVDTSSSALDASIIAVLRKLGKSADVALSPTQLLGLLLVLRSTFDSDIVDVTLLVSLIRSDEEEQFSALKTILPLLAEAREVVKTITNTFAFNAFVNLTAALLRLVGNDATSVDYDFVAHFEAIVQHECFAQILQRVGNDVVRLVVVRVIARLAHITNTYKRPLLQTLLSAYSMSLSPFDRSLRVLFEEFECQGSKEEELTLMSMGFRFGASSTITATSASASKQSHHDLVDDSAWVLGGGLEKNRVRATIEHFTLDREVSTAGDAWLLELDEDLPAPDNAEQDMVDDEAPQTVSYDPAFLLPMLSHFISSSDLPDGGIVQQGLLGVAIRATSSDVEKIREYAYGILAHLHESLQATNETTSEFKAGRQVHLLLDVFRRGVKEPLEQVPSVVTVFLNDALAVLTRPTHVLYPQVNHFLLARPAMDLADVPMFYSLFNSRTPLTFRQERSWLLHTLRRGVRSDDDVALLVRRHVLPMLMSFFTSELADTHTQPLITNILLATLRTPSGSVYLVTKAALLEWLAAQFLRLGAASCSDTSTGSMRTASLTLLLPLMTILEQTLQDEVWNELDAIQQHPLTLQAVNAFTSLYTTVVVCRTGSRNDRSIANKAAVVAELVVHRAGSVCSLELLHKAVDVAHQSDHDGIALDCAEVVTNNLTKWLLQRRHLESHKRSFSDWAVLLRQVSSVLVLSNTTGVIIEQQRARRALEQLKSVLDELPTLKQLVLTFSIADKQIVHVTALL
ncbi:putative mitochondrial protein [Phytophthora megakarya]|uniref:Putative mitochondrial protein n=1 Tax=Phytophthora megakarya TaxID=4795 RepID=A0A225W5N7_9STRA|nr:putative mitochondrial protein [Phytophthora megakarya]